MTAPTRDSRALIAARERAHYGVADEADAALLADSRHGTDRILARNILAVLEMDRILSARAPDAPYALDVEPARTRPLHVLLVIAAALAFPAVAVAAIIIERIAQ